ncbi:MAG TPA: hypothetical protein VMN56_17585 [Casimicrobiaceae bacterium]|nr:hypothetical protein [Casimicrobiaceae bacterium]
MPRSRFVAGLLALAASLALAQNGSRLSDPAPAAPSRWQQEQDTLDQALRARVLASAEPREMWVAGRLDSTDPWAQVAVLARARTQAPGEKVFIASLAIACLAPLQPLPAECDATDRLADWATRDEDNGVPALLLADRARRRNNGAAMVAYLEEVARLPRFDDYQNRAALILWEALRAVPGAVDPAARAALAANYAAAHASYAAGQMQSLCRDAQKAPDEVRHACAAAGSAVAQRASTWSLRVAGARLAERSALPGAGYDSAQRQLADVQRRAFECAEAGNAIAQALESPDASVRTRAVSQWEAMLAEEARVGEVAACGKG